MADISIGWNAQAQTLVATPSPFYAGTPTGQARQIQWDWSAPVDAVTITMTTLDGGPYPSNQPQPVCTSTRVTWTDPEAAQDTYEYTVSADISDVGARTLDPQIINTSGG